MHPAVDARAVIAQRTGATCPAHTQMCHYSEFRQATHHRQCRRWWPIRSQFRSQQADTPPPYPPSPACCSCHECRGRARESASGEGGGEDWPDAYGHCPMCREESLACVVAFWPEEWAEPAYQLYTGLLFGLPLAVTSFNRYSRFVEAAGRRLLQRLTYLGLEFMSRFGTVGVSNPRRHPGYPLSVISLEILFYFYFKTTIRNQ